MKFNTIFFIALFSFLSLSGIAQFNVLLVNDNANGPDRYLEIDTTLSNLGLNYNIYNTVVTGTFPDNNTLAPYDVVIWYTGNDGLNLKLWDVSNPDDYQFNAPLMSYLNNGGIVWLQGLDFLFDIVGTAPDPFFPGQFIYDYMGISSYYAQSYSDDGDEGVPQLDVVAGNPLCTFTPMQWAYATMWYVDALEITATAQGVYKMGPQNYALEGYISGVYNEFGDSKIFTLTCETARLDTEQHTDTLFAQVLDFFATFSSGDIPVENITISSEGGATSISENGGSLQMFAEVLPENATNPGILWSVENQTGTAQVNQSGLLQATGTTIGNGTILVKATAMDGSGVEDSFQVSISGQGADFEVLLVNDNDFAPTRYFDIDTTLTNLGYAYDVYNTVLTQQFPDITTLSFYDAVIWYTGNDGVNLYLWDVSDTNNYKFNPPLVQYLDAGGTVWLQGLDFLFDVYEAAPDSFVPGQFTYDYLGIESYAVQSHVDDGGIGLPQLDVVAGNGICTLTPLLWTYAEMWYADGLDKTDAATAVYKMGPADYELSGYYSGIYNVYGNAKIFTLAVETARIDTEQNTDAIFLEVLDYFENNTGTEILIEQITVSGEGGATTISENGGTLQMYADVLPENATNQNLNWSVNSAWGIATINQNGLLQSSGTSIGNGSVWVVAAAMDGSGVSDSLLITISNQGSDFEVLFVNDNGWDPARYLEIDTTLSNLDYTYQIYNTVTEFQYPDFNTLSAFDVVIWYTGNDGVDLYLWDTSDTLNYTFNPPLMQYLAAGGNVWLQGLDFLYDAVGPVPVSFTEGQFIYDKLGIKTYYAQSYADDGNMGLPQMDVIPGNPIATLSPVTWVFATMWYADALEITDDASGIYKMGPAGYVFDDYYTGVLKTTGSSNIYTLAIETARLVSEETTDMLFEETLEYFRLITGIEETTDSFELSEINTFPNPASDFVTFSFDVSKPAVTSLDIRDITGRLVYSQNIATRNPGKQEYRLSLTSQHFHPGVYTYTLTRDNKSNTGKFIIIK